MSDNEYDDEELASSVSSSPTIPDENIDFNFVYALHTFLATVEGQATCQKGDTLVLLDDTNSYWWLVRNIKDQSIGYLPAEHIETPPERLARFNKHRNVGEGASHLDDIVQPAPKPSKFSLRRNRKVSKGVVFAAPTVVVYDVYYDTDEERELEEAEAEAEAASAAALVNRSPAAAQPTSSHTIRSVPFSESQPAGEAALSPDRPTKKLTLTPDYAQDRPRAEQVQANGLLAAITSHASHGSSGSQGSISSVRSLLSESSSKLESPKDKKKKTVFGGLFRKKSKKESSVVDERSSEADSAQSGQVQPGTSAPSLVATPQADNITSDHTKRSSHARNESTGSAELSLREHKLSTDFDLPAAVQEMRSSKLMSIDPVEADFIDEPRHRGMVDEMELLETQRHSSLLLSHPDPPALNEAAIATHIKDDRFYKTFLLLVQDDASNQRSRHPLTQNDPAISQTFSAVESRLNAVLKELDQMLVHPSTEVSS